MSHAIRKHLGDFAAILVLAAVAIGCAAYILNEQRLRIPGLEDKPFTLKAEFSDAQGVMPGQGQTIRVAGMRIGDIGKVDEDGYFSIVDRKKELIITSGGKNISPANLEAALKTIPLVGQAAAIGDNRKFCSAILVLDPEATTVWAAAHGRAGATSTDLAADPDVIAEVQAGVDTINRQFAQVEQIKRFTLVGEEWLPDSDVLTPTSKLKRRDAA